MTDQLPSATSNKMVRINLNALHAVRKSFIEAASSEKILSVQRSNFLVLFTSEQEQAKEVIDAKERENIEIHGVYECVADKMGYNGEIQR